MNIVSTKYKNSAFSLIELLVVITIIGVLAAIAVPAYKYYLVTVRLGKAFSVVSDLADRSIAYSAQNGVFANAQQLGLNDGSNPILVQDVTIVPYALVFNNGSSNGLVEVLDNLGGVSNIQCGATGFVSAELDPTALGFDPSVATNVSIECDFWHYNGTIQNACTYYYGTVSTSGTGNLLPGAINGNTTTDWADNNYYAIINQNSFVNAQCQ